MIIQKIMLQRHPESLVQKMSILSKLILKKLISKIWKILHFLELIKNEVKISSQNLNLHTTTSQGQMLIRCKIAQTKMNMIMLKDNTAHSEKQWSL